MSVRASALWSACGRGERPFDQAQSRPERSESSRRACGWGPTRNE